MATGSRMQTDLAPWDAEQGALDNVITMTLSTSTMSLPSIITPSGDTSMAGPSASPKSDDPYASPALSPKPKRESVVVPSLRDSIRASLKAGTLAADLGDLDEDFEPGPSHVSVRTTWLELLRAGEAGVGCSHGPAASLVGLQKRGSMSARASIIRRDTLTPPLVKIKNSNGTVTRSRHPSGTDPSPETAHSTLRYLHRHMEPSPFRPTVSDSRVYDHAQQAAIHQQRAASERQRSPSSVDLQEVSLCWRQSRWVRVRGGGGRV